MEKNDELTRSEIENAWESLLGFLLKGENLEIDFDKKAKNKLAGFDPNPPEINPFVSLFDKSPKLGAAMIEKGLTPVSRFEDRFPGCKKFLMTEIQHGGTHTDNIRGAVNFKGEWFVFGPLFSPFFGTEVDQICKHNSL